MTRKQIVIVAVFVVFVAGGIFWGVSRRSDTSTTGRENTGTSQSVSLSSPYTPEVPSGATLTEPKTVGPATSVAGSTSKARFFDMKATKNGFVPSSLTVNAGDTVYIEFSAVDEIYDLDIPYLGVYFSAVQEGTSRRLPFDTPQSGTFLFSCRDFCPGKTIQGSLVVLPKAEIKD